MPPSISTRSGQFVAVAVGVLLDRAGEAAAHDLAHHPEVVVGLRGLDVELAVLVLEEPLGPGDDHRADRVAALDVAVVVDLDPARLLGQLEELGQLAQGARLGAGLGEAAVERFGGVAAGLLHQPPPVAALRHADLDPVPGRLAQRLLQQLALGQLAVDQDRARRRHFLVELRQHAGEHLVVLDPLRVAGEERAVAPVLPAAHEERLDRDLPAFRGERENVGVADAFGVDRLAALDEGRRAQPVAQDRRGLEVERLGGARHLHLDLLLHRARLAAEEVLRLRAPARRSRPRRSARRTAPSSA